MDGGPGKINLAVTSTGVRRSLLTPSGDSAAAAAVNYRAPARKRHSYSCLKKRKKEKERKQKRQTGFIRLSFFTQYFQNPSLGRSLRKSCINPNQETNVIMKGLFHLKVDLSSKRKHP